MCLRTGHSVDAAFNHVQQKRQGTASNLADPALPSAAASVIADTTPSGPPRLANNVSMQSVSSSIARPQADSWSFPPVSNSTGNNLPTPTIATDQSTAWPYPPISNETQYLQHDMGTNAYTYQPTEDDSQTQQFGLATRVSPLSTCSSSRASNAQDSYIQQPYSPEHLFFESTPQERANPAMYSNST